MSEIGIVIGALVGAAGCVFASYKTIVEAISTKTSRLKDEIEFVKSLIVFCQNSETHPLLIEKMGEVVFPVKMIFSRKQCLSSDEIKLLIGLPHPTETTRKYCLVKEYFTFDRNQKTFRLKAGHLNRLFQKILCYFGCIIFSFVAILPVLFLDQFKIFGFGYFMVASIWFVGFICHAGWFFKDVIKINMAEKLEKELLNMSQ